MRALKVTVGKSRAINDAFELMARGGSLFTCKDLTVRILSQSYAAARAKDNGLAMVNSDGLTFTCILSRDGEGLSFLVASD